MSLYGMLRTGVSGMNAQSNKLSSISDNVANSGTNGYKAASTEFANLITANNQTSYQSGAVSTDVRYAISKQGNIAGTTSPTDLAVDGDGFFLVKQPDGSSAPAMTRNGSFTFDAKSGNLVNNAGYSLLGYSLANGAPSGVLNGYAGLVPINIQNMGLQATPSTSGTLAMNLPDNAKVGDVKTTSITVYDTIGNEAKVDVSYTKTADSPSAAWTMTVTGPASPATSVMTTTTSNLTFDKNGKLISSPSIALNFPNTGQSVSLDITGTTNVAADFEPITADINGKAPSAVSGVDIATDGIVYVTYENGSRSPAFQIPLAKFSSPDNLQPISGAAFMPTLESGNAQIGFGGSAGMGVVKSSALESSNVDMASELTEMIVAQRDYTANSKVFQTGTELLDVLMNLKR